MAKKLVIFLLFLLIIILLPNTVLAEDKEKSLYEERLALYKKTAALTEIPWYYIAAVDQYERQIHKDLEPDQLISIRIPPEYWFGVGNASTDIKSIEFFNGIGKDGNGDKKADPENGEDVLFTMASYIKSFGHSEEDFKIALWNYYKRDLTVQTIKNTARVFKKFKAIYLTDRDFPVAINYNYSYRNTWGDRRGFGGNRIHEGTDIFAGYGTPVHSTTYGVVELKGWNLYGGWRVGIRDIFNIYHYYAHLSGFEEGLKVGQIVKPGDVLGSVGSTGYGPPGTSGKFPPHLHYGMYKDNGYSEWSFDPYPYLRKWERMARNKR
ncbi:M23 family metallopeptidase [Ornithinibacillus halotolerans]|uniref:L-Ala--D-Glu endopeptidase n=1 Tax=Ornithinibacillus halotolerans TaxID=1274357 RepID=A0A916RYL4_9BACI|nr:M23 family metallopeptidase [Ornithinibacillus halotolerans]GGA76766.1 L-Ala--D-Glu endopeptidase [Ornithinibacillus halotolerans]